MPTPICSEERSKIAQRLKLATPYGKPRRVWVDDGHVFVENHTGEVVSMTAAVALELGRQLSGAGRHSMVNHLLDRAGILELPSQ